MSLAAQLEEAIRGYDLSGDPLVTLYHGTRAVYAERLLKHGWTPSQHRRMGRNGGRGDWLYLTNLFKKAKWFAGSSSRDADVGRRGVVLRVTVRMSDLLVDPEDGWAETAQEELADPQQPGHVVATQRLPASAFKIVRSGAK